MNFRFIYAFFDYTCSDFFPFPFHYTLYPFYPNRNFGKELAAATFLVSTIFA